MNTFFNQRVPNSHYWTNLKQLLQHFKYIEEGIINDADELTKEHLIIGFNNCIKHGYKIVPTNKFNLVMSPVFTSINEIIDYINDEKYNQKEFCLILNNSINTGFNLSNGLKMERHDVYKRIDGERKYQDIRWNTNLNEDQIPDEDKSVAEWLNYIEYHLDKAKNENYHLNKEGALDELRKVAALAVRAMEIHGCPERQINPEIQL